MIASLSPTIRGVILDMDGVLWKDKQVLLDLPAFFDRLYARGLLVMLATNNATRSAEQYVEKLRGFGVANVQPEQVITSSMALTHMLRQQFPTGGPVYMVGEDGLVGALQAGGFYPAEEDVLAVAAGLDRRLTYEKLRRATLLIRAGAPFYGTNPDTTFPTPEGLVPGAGTVLAAIATASGVQPLIAGKPQPEMFLVAMERMGLRPEETLAIGDRLDTDILGGQRAGCRTALVLSGVTGAEELAAYEPKPDLVAARADDLLT